MGAFGCWTIVLAILSIGMTGTSSIWLMRVEHCRKNWLTRVLLFTTGTTWEAIIMQDGRRRRFWSTLTTSCTSYSRLIVPQQRGTYCKTSSDQSIEVLHIVVVKISQECLNTKMCLTECCMYCRKRPAREWVWQFVTVGVGKVQVISPH